MEIKELNLKGCFTLQPAIYRDDRGLFFESFNKRRFKTKTGIDIDFVQDNQSISARGVLRGLHYQKDQYAQAKLLRVIKGSVLDVAVDLRPDSSTFGEHIAVELSEQNNVQLFIPRGFAHGFLALEDNTVFTYKCDNYYNADWEAGIRFDDPQLDIDWPKNRLQEIKLSKKDLSLPFLKDLQ